MSRNRLRASRQYLGFSIDDVARHLGTRPDSVEWMEETGTVDGETLRRLAQLYRRTPGYLAGTESPPVVSDCVERMIEARRLTGRDAGELREFARFLSMGPSIGARA